MTVSIFIQVDIVYVTYSIVIRNLVTSGELKSISVHSELKNNMPCAIVYL